MKRLLFALDVFALVAVVFLVLANRNAAAAVEFCPAVVSASGVGWDFSAKAPVLGPETIYAVRLSAEGPRSVSGTLAFDTKQGWFTADIPPMTLASVADVLLPDASSTFYVRFPSAVVVSRSWMLTARSIGDTFGWTARGAVTCPAPPTTITDWQNDGPAHLPRLGPPATTPPSTGSIIVSALTSPSLGTTDCAKPFSMALAKKMDTPDYPEAALQNPFGPEGGETVAAVALLADGSIAQVNVVRSSGFAALDAATLQAAAQSTFQSARAYCMPVPGMFLFTAQFRPNV